MEPNYVQRLRLEFSKDGAARFISHLDLARALERALNRALIPVAYSQGFNRRPRMQLASALPLGYTSSCELADIFLTDRVEPQIAQEQLMNTMAPGIAINEIIVVPTQGKSLPALTLESFYVATPLDPVDVHELQARVAGLLSAHEIMRERGHGRKRKTYNLRPLVLDLSVIESEAGQVEIEMQLLQQPSLTGRPDEVLRELGLDPLDARIHRRQLLLQVE